MARRGFAALASVALVGAVTVVAPVPTVGAVPVAAFPPHVAQRPHVASTTGPVLSGTVTDESGDPLAGVQVYVLDRGSATSAADGTYSLRLPPGRRRVYFDGEQATSSAGGGTGYVGLTHTFQIGTTSFHAAPIVLPTGAAVTGHVVDAQGHPLRYATLSVLPIGQSNPYVDAVDDEGDYTAPVNFGVAQSHSSGRFTVTGAGAGTALVCFNAQDLEGLPTGGSAGNFGYQSVCSNRPIALVPGQTVSVGRLVLPLAHDGEIVGQVTRPDGRPIPYVDVMLNGRNSPYLSTDAFAEGNGRFTSPAIPPGRYEACPFLFFDSNHPTGGLYTSCVENEQVTAGQITHLSIHAHRGAAVRGTVENRAGRPLSGVYADYEQRGVASPAAGGARSDRHGHYTIYGVPPGRYAVCFTGAGFFSTSANGPGDPTGVLSNCAHPRDVTLRAGRLVGGVGARLSPGGAIAGRITDPNGRAFAHPSGIQMSVGGEYVTVAKDGSFFAPGLPDRTYKVCATSYAPAIVGTSCASGRVTVVAGKIAGGVHLVLNHAFRVVVHTVDADGHPLSGAEPTLLAPCTKHASSEGDCSTQPLFSTSQQVVVAASGSTDAAGTTVLYAQSAGGYSLCVYGYWAASATDDVTTGYGDACHDTTFGTAVGSGHVSLTQTLAAGGAVTGHVTDADGHPIAGARIEITNSGATDYRPAPNENGDDGFGDPTLPTPKAEARTDVNGDYTIYSVAAGSQQVCATRTTSDGAHHGCLPSPVAVTAGSTASAPALSISS